MKRLVECKIVLLPLTLLLCGINGYHYGIQWLPLWNGWAWDTGEDETKLERMPQHNAEQDQIYAEENRNDVAWLKWCLTVRC